MNRSNELMHTVVLSVDTTSAAATSAQLHKKVSCFMFLKQITHDHKQAHTHTNTTIGSRSQTHFVNEKKEHTIACTVCVFHHWVFCIVVSTALTYKPTACSFCCNCACSFSFHMIALADCLVCSLCRSVSYRPREQKKNKIKFE